MAKQNGYSFTPGKYDPVTSTDVVTEQEKSNERILESEMNFLDEMNARDDALVEKTRSEFESLTNLTSKGADWLKSKAEKDKKEKLQKASYLAMITPATKEDIQALVDREKGLKDSHLRLEKIAKRIEETTGSYKLAQQFLDLSGYEQYRYVKDSLTYRASNYSDFKNEAKNTTFITVDGKQIGYNTEGVTKPQLDQLNAKVRFDFAGQFIGVNEDLLRTTVGAEIIKVDAADTADQITANDTLAKNNDKRISLERVTTLIVDDPAESRKNVDDWLLTHERTHNGALNAKLVLRDRIYNLVLNGKLDFVKARAMVKHIAYHSGDKKGKSLEDWEAFKGLEDDLIQANAQWQTKRLDTEKNTVIAEAEALRNSLKEQNTVLSLDQKKAYMKERMENFPDVPLNADEQFILYGYRDDEAMRTILLQKAESQGGITAKDLEHASPTIRNEFANELIPDQNQQLISIYNLPQKDQKFITDQVGTAAGNTGALDAKNIQYYALMTEAENEFVTVYNTNLASTQSPDLALDAAKNALVLKLADDNWVDKYSKWEPSKNQDEYMSKLVAAGKQVQPETGGYKTKLLEAPKDQKELLQDWAANGGKGPVPYYYRALASNNNILPRELAWRQANMLGYEGKWDEKAELKKYNIPKYLITQFCKNPTACKFSRFKNDVEEIDNINNGKNNEEEVNFYEENEDID